MAAVWRDDDDYPPGYGPQDDPDDRPDWDRDDGPQEFQPDPPPLPPDVEEFARIMLDVSIEERKSMAGTKTPDEFAAYLHSFVDAARDRLYANDAHGAWGLIHQLAAAGMIWLDQIDTTQKFIAALDVPPRCEKCGQHRRLCSDKACPNVDDIPF